MLLIDDPTQIGAVLRVVAVPFFQNFSRFFQELLLDLLRAQQIIWRNAGLASVDELAPQDPFRCNGNVRCAVDVAGALAT